MAEKRGPVFTKAHEQKIEKMKEFMAVHTAFNSALEQKIEGLTNIMGEIHNKLDKTLLNNTEKFAKIEGREALFEEKLKALKEESKKRSGTVWTVIGLFITIVAAVIGAILAGK